MKAADFLLPPNHELKVDYILAWVEMGLMVVASVVGIAFQSQIYSTEGLALSFLANDVVNLVVGIPVLLVPMWLTRRGRLAGVLYWMGAYLYVAYNYLVYLFAMPLNAFYIFYPVVVGLAVLGFLRLFQRLDKETIRQKMNGKVAVRWGGGVLVLLGLGFALRAIGIVAGSFGAGGLSREELALNLADSILSIGWIVGGIALWRRTAFGFSVGGGLLYQGSMLFVAVIMLAVLMPWMFGIPIVWVDVIVLAVMALVVVVPFGLFMHGIRKLD